MLVLPTLGMKCMAECVRERSRGVKRVPKVSWRVRAWMLQGTRSPSRAQLSAISQRFHDLGPELVSWALRLRSGDADAAAALLDRLAAARHNDFITLKAIFAALPPVVCSDALSACAGDPVRAARLLITVDPDSPALPQPPPAPSPASPVAARGGQAHSRGRAALRGLRVVSSDEASAAPGNKMPFGLKKGSAASASGSTASVGGKPPPKGAVLEADGDGDQSDDSVLAEQLQESVISRVLAKITPKKKRPGALCRNDEFVY
jgi:hypothetical protein